MKRQRSLYITVFITTLFLLFMAVFTSWNGRLAGDLIGGSVARAQGNDQAGGIPGQDPSSRRSAPSRAQTGSDSKAAPTLQERIDQGIAPPSRTYRQVNLAVAATHRLPAVSELPRREPGKPPANGMVRDVPEAGNISTSSTLYPIFEGNVRALKIVSEGAARIRVHFTELDLPPGARLFVSSLSNPEEIHGPYEDRGPFDDATLWTPPLTGDGVVIEYFAPASISEREAGSVPFRIAGILHLFSQPRVNDESSNLEKAGECNIDVPEVWANTAKTVAQLEFVRDGKSYLCTGTLMNSIPFSGTPYLLTANHCFSTQSSAQSLTAYWFYDTGDSPPRNTPRTDGADLLSTGRMTDYTLVKLRSSPPNDVWFSGWDGSVEPDLGTRVTGIHHPGGSYKRISHGQTLNKICQWGRLDPCENFHTVAWLAGVTEGGSSGSGLWKGTSSDPRLVGTLLGGVSSCNNPTAADYYGRFDLTFDQIYSFLNGSCRADVPADSWKGEYFSNQTLSGDPALVRDDGRQFLDYDWDVIGPCSACGIGSDNFSARWTRTVNFEPGVYRFYLRGDDGIRLFVDDILRRSEWRDQAAATYTVDVSLTAGNHTLRLEYYENAGGAEAALAWEKIADLPATCGVNSVDAGRWRGEYFNNLYLSGTAMMVRDDGGEFLDQNYGLNSPNSGCGFPADNFSARWRRRVTLPAGSYRFTATGDDGIRLYVDGVKLIDKWIPQAATSYQADVSLTAGDHDLVLEYFEMGGQSLARLSWTLVSSNNPLTCPAMNVPTDRWEGRYYIGLNPSGSPAMVRDDGGGFLDQNYGDGSPQDGCGFPTDNFSVRWRRRVTLNAGTYRFTATGDDGIRFYLDGQRVIDKWIPQSESSYSTDLTLTAGTHELVLEYFEMGGQSVARLSWSAISTIQPPPTVDTFVWTPTIPVPSQPFLGTISGTNFVINGTRVYFCAYGTNTCYEHSQAGVTVNRSTNLSVREVRLGAGWWQVFLETYAGRSNRSAPFAVR